MIQPGEIQSIAGKKGVRDTQIEKDYVISWVIYGISNNSFLKENLIFKGGTVLKKVHFPDYRFSEDLDFTFKEKDFAKHWQEHLTNQTTEIPDFNDVWRELGKHWRKFQKFIE